MKRIIALLAVLTLFTSMGAAQQQQTNSLVNTVIVTSTNSTQDTLIATGPARKLGIPILHTSQNSIPEPTRDTIQLLQPENIVIIGGPDVIDSNLESELGNISNSTTTRIWGNTATETSIRTSRYYWPEGHGNATILHLSENQDATQFASVIQELEAGKPILISRGENLSGSVLGEIQRVNGQQVTIYGASEQQVNQSQIVNIAENVEVVEGSPNEIDRLKANQASNIVNAMRPNGTLVLAAGQEENGKIATIPYLMDLYVFGIQDESHINTAVGLSDQVNTENIWATGSPELVNDIEIIVEDVTDKDVRVIEGNQLEVIERVIRRQLSSAVTTQEALYQPWFDHLEGSTMLQISAETHLEEARNVVNQNAPQQVQTTLNQAEQAYQQGNWFEARRLATQASSQARINRLMQETGDGLIPGNQGTNQTDNGGILN